MQIPKQKVNVLMRKMHSKIANHEGKKVEVGIGNIREVIRVMTDVLADEVRETGGQVMPNSMLNALSIVITEKIAK
jgi:hypothetical protein